MSQCLVVVGVVVVAAVAAAVMGGCYGGVLQRQLALWTSSYLQALPGQLSEKKLQQSVN